MFKKICLGMEVNGKRKWMKITHRGSSLYDVIADDNFRRIGVARNKWSSLLQGAKLQAACHDEKGFNIKCAVFKAEIGIIGNNEKRATPAILGWDLVCRLVKNVQEHLLLPVAMR